MMVADKAAVDTLLRLALDEDLGEAGDLSTAASIPVGSWAEARVLVREPGVLAGVEVAQRCFELLDPDVELLENLPDGLVLDGQDAVPDASRPVLVLRGPAPAILGAERTALNFLQRLSGIATATRQFVQAVEGTTARIMDTRKTTPLLRSLEKYAVQVGGGVSHRQGLYDQILLKENHFALAGRPYEEVVCGAVQREQGPVIAEARCLEEARAAVRGGAAVVLLDNFELPSALAEATRLLRQLAKEMQRPVEIEASGGVTLENVRAVAACGVDRISIGALTHSVKALDFSLLVQGDQGSP